MPIVLQDDGSRVIESMKWGLVPSWARDTNVGYKMINARAENVFDKPAWRGPILRTRCLVPASGFYEWKQVAGERLKRPVYIRPQDEELFAFAGMYSTWRGPMGNQVRSYSIVTSAPNQEVRPIHDRMPVILHPDDWSVWLDTTVQERGVLEELLRPYDDGALNAYEVSTDVNVVQVNDEHLVQPVNG